MVRALSSFMEFCYLIRHSVINEDDLIAIDNAVANFHWDHVIFDEVRPDGYLLPCQHSLVHYSNLICEFGAPNGLCSSITESKHIKAVKEPWRCSSCFEALGQMLLTNQRLRWISRRKECFGLDFLRTLVLNHRLYLLGPTTMMMMMGVVWMRRSWVTSISPKSMKCETISESLLVRNLSSECSQCRCLPCHSATSRPHLTFPLPTIQPWLSPSTEPNSPCPMSGLQWPHLHVPNCNFTLLCS